ncbi:MAG: hypothetical protein M5R38_02550 [Candidatus Methylomirabilis sp.]|nr:hypothetical protein [Candidatus Methylomirabilis sp.]
MTLYRWTGYSASSSSSRVRSAMWSMRCRFSGSLRRRYPDRYIAWLIEEEAAGLLLGHPLLDRVIVSGRRRWGRAVRSPLHGSGTLREVAALIAELRRGQYDLVIDLQGLLKSALMVLCAGAPFRVGLAGAARGAGAR